MIKRTIYLNNLEDLDLNNIGCHFTSDLNYKHTGGGSNGPTNTKTAFRVDIFVEKCAINEQATKYSNNNYSSESEVVLEMNQEVEAIVEIRVGELIGNIIAWSGRPVERRAMKGNTGTRADLWVKNQK